jgi:large subunit ribosomal protein L30
VPEKTHKTIRIKWVRSGIGFTYRQKSIVRSLGLRRLNQTVVRPDTPQIRGIVAAVPHLLEIVPETTAPAWASIPEYSIYASVKAEAAPPAEAAGEEAVSEGSAAEAAAGAEPPPAVEGDTETTPPPPKEVKPAKGAGTKSQSAEKEETP